jgi:hypothetical protein
MTKLIKIKKAEFQPLYEIACADWKTKLTSKFDKFLFEDYIEFEEPFLETMRLACNDKQIKVFNKVFKTYLEEKVSIFDTITYSQVCKNLKERELTEDDFKNLPTYMIRKALAQAQIQQVEKFFNGDWIKDWNNGSQPKWYPYFEKRSGGWVFCLSSCCYDVSSGLVGFYKDQATSDHVGKHFLHLYVAVS